MANKTNTSTAIVLCITFCIMLCITVLGCDSSTLSAPDDADLNQELIDLITLDGQRRLENFILPESGDFSKIPGDLNNPLSAAKVELGKLLFHEPALSELPLRESGRGTYSCSTCHHADAGFEAGRQFSIGDGGIGWGQKGEGRRPSSDYDTDDVDIPGLKSPTILNKAFQKVMLWSGAAGANGPNEGTEASWDPNGGSGANHFGYDGLESQAIVALTAHRMYSEEPANALISTTPEYANLWANAFPGRAVTDETIGLAIAAFERTVMANRAPFQMWLKGDRAAMTPAEKRGALVFFGDSGCSNCHAGPALSSMAFYALGIADGAQGSSRGRGDFVGDGVSDFKFKVPQLYNLNDSPFYGHAGTISSLAEMVDYYVQGVPELALPAGRVAEQFRPLDLSSDEIRDLVVFLKSALRDPDLSRYQPDSVPSGGCVPANDPQARVDLGCS